MKPPFFVPALVAMSLCTCSYFAPSARGADPPDASQEVSVQSPDSVTLSIPGPLRSFLRMAGISQKISPGGVAPLLARYVFHLGCRWSLPNGRSTRVLLPLIRLMQ